MYIAVKGTIKVPNTGRLAAPNNRNEEVVFKNCASLANCISEIDNTQIVKAKDIDVVIDKYNVIEHSENYSQTSESLWQYCRDQPADDGDIIDFPGKDDTSLSFKYKKIYN